MSLWSARLRRVGKAARIAFALTALWALAAPARAGQAFVYEGGGCIALGALTQYQMLFGSAEGVVDFADDASWSAMIGGGGWGINCWKGHVHNLALSIPLAVVSGPNSHMEDVAAGRADAYYTTLFRALVSNGFPNAYLRLGWEFNGDWYPWTAKGHPALYVAAFQHVAALARNVSPGFRIVWNPVIYTQGIAPDQAYPGDAYVDVIGLDAYNATSNPGLLSARNTAIEPDFWNHVNGDPWGVAQFLAFAKAHGKPYAFPEWGSGERPDGHGGGDDPTFMTQMLALTPGAEFDGYWDFNASDYRSLLLDPHHTRMMAVMFAHRGIPRVNAIIAKSATTFTPSSTPPAFACDTCHVAAIQNGPSHWVLVVDALAAHPSATVTWGGFTASSVKIYDLAQADRPIKTLANLSSAPLVLTPFHPMLIEIQK